MSIFEKYSNKFNAEDLAAAQEEINANADGGGKREEVPVGKYEVKVDRLECKLSKNDNPMVSIWFRILTGKFEKSVIFYNGVLHHEYPRRLTRDLLNALLDDGDHRTEIAMMLKSGDVELINNFCMDIHETIDGKYEYLLDYGMSKGYNTYAIEEVYEA